MDWVPSAPMVDFAAGDGGVGWDTAPGWLASAAIDSRSSRAHPYVLRSVTCGLPSPWDLPDDRESSCSAPARHVPQLPMVALIRAAVSRDPGSNGLSLAMRTAFGTLLPNRLRRQATCMRAQKAWALRP